VSLNEKQRAYARERSARKREVRGHTINPGGRFSRKALALLTEPEPVDHWRPTVRGECLRVPRPCPFVSCHWNLYLDVNPRNGSIRLNFPDLEPGDLEHSCALDLAERGGMTLEEVGPVMNLTRERIRQIQDRLIVRLRLSRDAEGCRP